MPAPIAQLIKQLTRDDSGAILSAEAILILTILVIGSVVGLAQVTGAVTYGMGGMYSSFERSNSVYAPTTYGSDYRGGYTAQNAPDAPTTTRLVSGDTNNVVIRQLPSVRLD